eukprot:9018090-Karenia_brevis.AAC.1
MLKCPHCSHSWAIGLGDDRFFSALDIPTHDGKSCMRTVRSCMEHYLKEEPVDDSYRWAGCQNCGASSGRPLKYLRVTVASQ